MRATPSSSAQRKPTAISAIARRLVILMEHDHPRGNAGQDDETARFVFERDCTRRAPMPAPQTVIGWIVLW
jgi:hypothetical protein